MSTDELLSEAYVRAAATSRNWPVGIEVVRFIAGTMRSIASGAGIPSKRRRAARLLLCGAPR